MLESVYTALFSHGRGLVLYNLGRKYFTLTSLLLNPVLMIINAPFGRFTPSPSSPFSSSLLIVDGIKSWMLMELVSPLTFFLAYLSSPLSLRAPLPPPPLLSAPTLFAGLYLVHYLNRAVLSPLRTPSRSKSHLVVPLAGVTFNTINGFLMGAYLSSPYARIRFASASGVQVGVGLFLWVVGFVGNVVHDEILLDIRRKALSKDKGNGGEHYAIPQGLLYKYVSYPNYFCEWVEWFGFALASSPSPLPFSLTSLSPSSLTPLSLLTPLRSTLLSPASLFAPSLAPPYIFLLTEVLLMLPRAYKGHLWYREKFGERYPRERRVVVPFVL